MAIWYEDVLYLPGSERIPVKIEEIVAHVTEKPREDGNKIHAYIDQMLKLSEGLTWMLREVRTTSNLPDSIYRPKLHSLFEFLHTNGFTPYRTEWMLASYKHHVCGVYTQKENDIYGIGSVRKNFENRFYGESVDETNPGYYARRAKV